MPLVDLIDETFVVAAPEVIAGRLNDEDLWHTWWPDLELSIFMNRGNQGIRWSVSGRLVGSCEVWLEPFADGVVVHYYLRAELSSPEPSRGRRRVGERLRRAHAQRWKRHLNALKDELEAGRAPGRPRSSRLVI